MIGGISKREFDEYLGDVEKCTGRKIGAEQRDKLYEFLRTHDVSCPVDDATYEAIKDDFDKRATQKRLRSEWSEKNNEEWPTYEKNNIGNNKIKAKGKHNYDLHHIIPKKYGGPNEWWNMIPAASPEQH